MKNLVAALLILLASANFASACDLGSSGKGIVYAPDYNFKFTPPTDWITQTTKSGNVTFVKVDSRCVNTEVKIHSFTYYGMDRALEDILAQAVSEAGADILKYTLSTETDPAKFKTADKDTGAVQVYKAKDKSAPNLAIAYIHNIKGLPKYDNYVVLVLTGKDKQFEKSVADLKSLAESAKIQPPKGEKK